MAKSNNKPATPAPSAPAPAPVKAAAPAPSAPAPAAAASKPATAAAPQAKTESKTASSSGPTHEQISRRAYEIYQARGGQDGRHHDDWLQAERELRLGKQ